jgi:hypothetical protein
VATILCPGLCKKFGFQVSLLFVLVHYQYKGPMNVVFEFLNKKKDTTREKRIEHATQTKDDCEAACCSEAEFSEGSSKMETDVSQSSSHETAVEP